MQQEVGTAEASVVGLPEHSQLCALRHSSLQWAANTGMQ